jgi:hypothetical protein
VSEDERFVLDPLWGGPLRIWKMPEPGQLYVIGVDPASGKTELDWAAAVVVECSQGSTVATWRGHIEPSPFAEIVFTLGSFYGRYMNPSQAFLCPETNNHGIAFLDAIRAIGYINIYTRQTWDRIGNTFTPTVGFCTSMKTKPMLIKRGREALSNPKCRIRDKIILQEASTFITNDAGREEAMEGSHDDTLFAWMLAQEGRHTFYVESGMASVPEGGQREMGMSEARRQERNWVWKDLEEKAEDSHARYVHYMGS